MLKMYFVFTYFRANQVSSYTKDTFRTPGTVLLTYRCLQIIHGITNYILSDILIVVNMNCMLIAVLCNFTLVRFHTELPWIGNIGISLFLILCIGYVVTAYSKLGETYNSSKLFLISWKQNPNLSKLDRNMMTKYLQSCRLLRYNTGVFGFHQKSATLRVVAKIVFFTVKLLVLTK